MLRKVPPARRPAAVRRTGSPRSHRRAGRKRTKNELTITGMQAGGAREASSQDPPRGGGRWCVWRVWDLFEWWPREQEKKKKEKTEIGKDE